MQTEVVHTPKIKCAWKLLDGAESLTKLQEGLETVRTSHQLLLLIHWFSLVCWFSVNNDLSFNEDGIERYRFSQTAFNVLLCEPIKTTTQTDGNSFELVYLGLWTIKRHHEPFLKSVCHIPHVTQIEEKKRHFSTPLKAVGRRLLSAVSKVRGGGGRSI